MNFVKKNRKEYKSNLWAILNENAWNQWINYFLKAIISQAKLNTKRAKQVPRLYDEMKKVIHEISQSRSAMQIQDFLFSKIMFETPDFTRSSDLSKPHAARIIRNTGA